jgi:hypothetical protein
LVEIQDFELEEFMISEPVGLLLKGFDFADDSFYGTGGYGVIIISRESPAREGLDCALPGSIDARLNLPANK